MSDDPRKGLPSGSEYHRVVKCPGMLNLRRRSPSTPSKDSEDAASGVRCHAAYALWNDEPDYPERVKALELTVDEENCVEYALEQTAAVLKQLKFDTPATMEMREKRIFLKDPATSGQFDRCYVQPKRALVVDFKSGRDPVDPIEENYQMRHYGVLVAAEFLNADVDEVFVAVAQPWVSKVPTIARYDKDEIARALAEMRRVFALADKSTECIPGKWCSHCDCSGGACTVAQDKALEVLNVVPVDSSTPGEVKIATPAETALSLADEDLATFLLQAEYATGIIKACRDEAKARMKAGRVLPGWRISKGKELSTITDTERVYTRALELGLKHEAFMGCISIGKEKLTKAVREAKGIKGKTLDGTVEALLDGCLASKVSEGSLERDEPKPAQ